MESQFLIADVWEFNAYPAGAANIGRPVKFIWARFDQGRLNANGGWDHYGNVPIVVMIDGAHSKDLLTNEEGGFAV